MATRYPDSDSQTVFALQAVTHNPRTPEKVDTIRC